MRRNKAPSQSVVPSKVTKFEELNKLGEKLTGNSCLFIEKNKKFSVVYGKITKKKHKTWDGDGKMIVYENTIKVFDEEGKEIGTVPKRMVKKIEEGEVFYVGGKMVEILNELVDENSGEKISKEDVFIDNAVRQEFRPVKPSEVVADAVRQDYRPVMKVDVNLDEKQSPEMIRNEVLMPRPPSTFLFLRNSECQEVQDVRLDGNLSSKMRPDQIEGAKFLYSCVMGFNTCKTYELRRFCGCILADSMGMGKSLQTIAVIWTLLKQSPFNPNSGEISKCLILAPTSLVANWANEFKKWIINQVRGGSISVFVVSSDVRPEQYCASKYCPIMIASYEMACRCEKVLRDYKFDLIVCDEAHRLKNMNVRAAQFVATSDISKRILLTGTPVQNNAEELFSLAELACPGLLAEGNKEEFKKMTSNNSSRLNSQIKNILLRRCTTESCKNPIIWPDKDEYLVFCEATDVQMKLHECVIAARNKFVECNEKEEDATSLLCILLLRKLSFHPHLFVDYIFNHKSDSNFLQLLCKITQAALQTPCLTDSMPQVNSINQSPKLSLLNSMLKQLDSENCCIIIASHFIKNLDMAAHICHSLYGPDSTARIDGSTHSKVRHFISNLFSTSQPTNTRPFILLLTCKAAGEGLNLVRASKMILLDPEWNPALDLQMISRIWRQGNVSEQVSIYRLLVANSIDENILQRQTNKQRFHIGSNQSNPSNDSQRFSDQELKDIFSSHNESVEKYGCWTHELIHRNKEDSEISLCCHGEVVYEEDDEDHNCQLGCSRGPTNSLQEITNYDLSKWSHYIGDDVIGENCNDRILLAGLQQIRGVFYRHTFIYK